MKILHSGVALFVAVLISGAVLDATVSYADTVQPANSPNQVVFDGGVTYLSGDATYATHQFVMKNGAIIVIGSHKLSISAQVFTSDGGKIVAFYGPTLKALPGPNGTSAKPNGSDGIGGTKAGQVSLVADRLKLANVNVPLVINMIGQTGGDGGTGAHGRDSQKGKDGQDAGTRYVDRNGDTREECFPLPEQGHPADPGMVGGNGGGPGSGGAGGMIQLHLTHGNPSKLVKESVSGGDGGFGGQAGLGGFNGPPGDPGRGKGSACDSAAPVTYTKVQAKSGIDMSHNQGPHGLPGQYIVN